MKQKQKARLIALGVALASLVFTATNSSYAQNENYRAKMRGNNEVPPVTTSAEGVINFKTKNEELTWKLNVTGITDATGAHIHKGKNGTNGDVVVDLLKVSKHSNTPQGMILRGNITDSSLTGPMKGQTLADLKTAMSNGDTYVNVHTKDHPNGEIRGQVKLKESDGTTSNATISSNNTNSQ